MRWIKPDLTWLYFLKNNHPALNLHCHAATPYYAYFLSRQDEIIVPASSSNNLLSCHIPSWVETKGLDPHHHCSLPFLDSSTLTLNCYKKIISTLVTLSIIELCFHLASSLVRVSRHQSSTRHHCSLSPLSQVHCPSTQWHILKCCSITWGYKLVLSTSQAC
jgi:hypothetical protein